MDNDNAETERDATEMAAQIWWSTYSGDIPDPDILVDLVVARGFVPTAPRVHEAFRAAHDDGSLVIIWETLAFYLGGVQRNPLADAIDAAFEE